MSGSQKLQARILGPDLSQASSLIGQSCKNQPSRPEATALPSTQKVAQSCCPGVESVCKESLKLLPKELALFERECGENQA